MTPVLVSMFGTGALDAPVRYRQRHYVTRREMGNSVSLSDPEMGVAFTSIIAAIGSGVAAAAKGIGSAARKRRAQKAETAAAAAAAAAQQQEIAAKRKRTTLLIVIGGLVAAGAGTILLTGRD